MSTCTSRSSANYKKKTNRSIFFPLFRVAFVSIFIKDIGQSVLYWRKYILLFWSLYIYHWNLFSKTWLNCFNLASLFAHSKSWRHLNDLKGGKITDKVRETQSLLFWVSSHHFPLGFDDIIMVEKSKLICWNREKNITFC